MGKNRVEGLGLRMEKVRNKVMEQETKEGQWSERVRRRVRLCWGVLALGLILGVVGILVKHWPRVERGAEEMIKRADEIGNIPQVREITTSHNGNESMTTAELKIEAVGVGREHDEDRQNRVFRILDEL